MKKQKYEYKCWKCFACMMVASLGIIGMLAGCGNCSSPCQCFGLVYGTECPTDYGGAACSCICPGRRDADSGMSG